MTVRQQASPRTLSVAGASLIAVSFGLARYGYGLFAPQFQQDLRLSTAQIGTFSSLSYVGYGVGLVVCPWLVRRFDARAAVLTSSVLVCVGIFAIALAASALELAGAIGIAGIGVGLAWPPFSELAADHIDASRRPRVVSTISTGTSLGLILAVPLALLAGHAWHAVWAGFGVLALLALAVNASVLPRGAGPGRLPGAESSRRPEGRGLALLAIYSLVYGAIGAAFFTFAIELAHTEQHSRTSSVLLWAIVGTTGLAAVNTGELISHLGLRNAVRVLLAGMAAALLCIGLIPTSLIALDIGAAIFGPFYMAGAAVVPRWSEHLDPISPARVHSLATGASAIGSITGAATAGAIASTTGLPTIFLASAALACLASTTLKAPR